ncbi:MAG: T9SS C-terminal target domain-containing protein [Candidatus Zixiibacteriota bacterium]|nr:MAG: T9SS C-terminal target domain-containing protein [candidate division Zixibacteria bacterium]
MMNRLTLPALCALVWVAPAAAQWPTTVNENLPVATDPTRSEAYPSILPFTNGSTLVAFLHSGPLENVYQIINLNGALVYSDAQPLVPGLNLSDPYFPRVVSDSTGGAVVAWYVSSFAPNSGYYAQRLDASGNRVWGEMGVRFGNARLGSSTFDVCPDGLGGFFYATDGGASTLSQIQAYHVGAGGELLWGGLSGIPVATTSYHQGNPFICPDGQGGIFIVWKDFRPPYSMTTAVFGQHLDAAGNRLWGNSGQVVHPAGPWMYQIIPDGQGGIILHCGAGGPNWAYRYSEAGTQLWVRDHVSWWDLARIIPGEPGFFYLGFTYGRKFYAQRMDMEGNFYWPSWGSGEVGQMMIYGGMDEPSIPCLAYRAPYLYGMAGFKPSGSAIPVYLRGQKMDAQGRRQWGDQGTLLTRITEGNGWPQSPDVVADAGGGLVGVYHLNLPGDSEIWAKRCRSDGSLGGPPSPYAPVRTYPATMEVTARTVRFTLPQAGYVRLEVFDTAGRRVAGARHASPLPAGEAWYPAGTHEVTFDGSALPSGIYFVRLTAGGMSQVQKMVLLK